MYGVQCANHRAWDGMGCCSHKILKERKSEGGGGGKEKRKRNVIFGNVSTNPDHLPVKRISQTFHCFFPVIQATMTHSLQEFTQTQVVYVIFILFWKKKKSVRYEYQPL